MVNKIFFQAGLRFYKEAITMQSVIPQRRAHRRTVPSTIEFQKDQVEEDQTWDPFAFTAAVNCFPSHCVFVTCALETNLTSIIYFASGFHQ